MRRHPKRLVLSDSIAYPNVYHLSGIILNDEDTMQFSYTEALAYTLQHHAPTYAFLPTLKKGKVVGGRLYVLVYEPDHEEYPESYCLWTSSGQFSSDTGEVGSYMPDEIPVAATQARYEPAAAAFNTSYFDYELQIALQVLRGVSLQQALQDDEEW